MGSQLASFHTCINKTNMPPLQAPLILIPAKCCVFMYLLQLFNMCGEDLHTAAYTGDLQQATDALDNGVSPAAAYADGEQPTALHLAAGQGHLHVARSPAGSKVTCR